MIRSVAEEPREVTPSRKELLRKAVAERMDKRGLLRGGKTMIDSSVDMLKRPAKMSFFLVRGFTIARKAPKITFTIIPTKPMWFGEVPSGQGHRVGPWSNWGQAAYCPETGKFFSSVGDHCGYNAHLHIVEYDPDRKRLCTHPEINRALGRTENQFGDGRIYGWLDFYQSQYLTRPHVWFSTFSTRKPGPQEEKYATGYGGGHILSYDPVNGDLVDYGVPLVRVSWSAHRVDTKRGIFYAVGPESEFLAWDMNEQRVKWGGHLPDGMKWMTRTILIDDETGMVYTSNIDESDKMGHFIKYDPFKNSFHKLKCHLPKDSLTSKRRGREGSEYSYLRAHTRKRGPDGLFWCVTSDGQFFTFDPVKQVVTNEGINWPGKQRYTASLDRSPGGRYVYYLPGAHGHGYTEGSPVVQLDTKTGLRKVLAFLFPHYYCRYGFITGGTFCIKLDDKGERLFVLHMGAFAGIPQEDVDVFGQCAIMMIEIPESERLE